MSEQPCPEWLDMETNIKELEKNGLNLKEIWKTVKNGFRIAKNDSKKDESQAEFLYQLAVKMFIQSPESYIAARKLIDKALIVCPHSAKFILFKIISVRALILYTIDKPNLHNAIEWCARKAQEIFDEAKLNEARIPVAEREKFRTEFRKMMPDPNVKHSNPAKKQVKQATAKELNEFLWDDRLVLKSEKYCGRLIAARESIPAGTQIVKENAFLFSINFDNLTKVCSRCCRKLSDAIFWPCINCQDVVYCSEECEAKNRTEGVHRFECGLLPWLAQGELKWLQIFRLLCPLGDYTLMNLDKKLEEVVKSSLETLIQHKTGRNEISDLAGFQILLSLEAHLDVVDKGFNFKILQYSLEIAMEVAIQTGLMSKRFIREKAIKLIKIVYNVYRRLQVNNFSMQSEKSSVYGSACVLASSMFNHSCNNNSDWKFKNNSIVITTKRDIKAGEELNINYGVKITSSFEERQVFLIRAYHFQCRCQACTEDILVVPGLLKCHSCCGPIFTGSVLLKDEKPLHDAVCTECGEKYLEIEKYSDQLENYIEEFVVANESYKLNKNLETQAVLESLFIKIRHLICNRSVQYKDTAYILARTFHNIPEKYKQIIEIGVETDEIMKSTSDELSTRCGYMPMYYRPTRKMSEIDQCGVWIIIFYRHLRNYPTEEDKYIPVLSRFIKRILYFIEILIENHYEESLGYCKQLLLKYKTLQDEFLRTYVNKN